jgi:hypothetical protein
MAEAGRSTCILRPHNCQSFRRGGVLVRVRATGVTPTELTWDATYQNAADAAVIPGHAKHLSTSHKATLQGKSCSR